MKIRKYLGSILIKFGIKKERAQVLSKLINKFKFESFIELGSWKGETSYKIINACKTLKKVYLIDPMKAKFNEVKEYDYTCGMGKEEPYSQEELDKFHQETVNKFKNVSFVNVIRLTSKNAVKQFDDISIDIIFIDAIHLYDYVKEDILLWAPKIRSKGIIAGHDYQKTFPGVIKAINEFCDKKNLHIESDSVWWFWKKDIKLNHPNTLS